jgi:putative ABC transport system permease protein
MFDLENAIRQWRATLEKNEALEDGYKEELESHLRDKIDHFMSLGKAEETAFDEAVRMLGDPDSIGADFFRTDTRRRHGRFPWEERRLAFPLLAHYFKIGFRKLKRQKLYSLINIAGLAVGLACCAVIILYVANELTYDRFHPEAGRVFRVAAHFKNPVGEYWSAATQSPLGPALKADYPQVEKAVRLVPPPENASHVLVVRDDRRFFERRVWFVDNEIFQVFRLPFVQGRPEAALIDPYSVVITEGMARKYFGNDSALGKTLNIEIDYDTPTVEGRDFVVTGVIKNAPLNTHFKYDLLLSMATMRANDPKFEERWEDFHYKYTYVKLGPSADVKDIEKQIQGVAARSLGPGMEFFRYVLQPVAGIHMNSRFLGEIEPPGNWNYIAIYSMIAFLILLIGCMNFVNLSAALSSTRTREVGLRKVVGAGRRQLIRQFLGESFLITLAAFAVAFVLAYALLIPFNRMAGTQLSLAGFGRPVVALSLLGLLVLVGFGAGFYPAVVLTAFKPVSVLQGKTASALRGSLMQKVLVVGQFGISVFLVICTLIVFRQLGFMRGSALGFNPKQKLILRVQSNLAHLRRDYEDIKKDFLRNPAVTGAVVSSSVPGDALSSGYYLTTKPGDFKNAPRLLVITVDYDFLSEYGIKMLAGRPFERGLGSDAKGAFVVNRAGARALGFSSAEEALGKGFQAHYNRLTKQIIGVTDDFHYRGMKELVGPLILDIESSLMSTITLSIRTDNMADLMRFVRAQWDVHFPGVPFEYSFLDENFDREYRYEEQMSKMLGMIAALGIGVACLGLFGLASFVVLRRQKEIGVRKVLGASTANIVGMLSRKYVLLILVSVALASPAAWFSMKTWLQGFAYRIDVGWVVFVLAAAGALGVALLTVGIHGIRASGVNPADSLHTE